MGKGDRKTKKGKITKGTFGNRRPRKANSAQQSESKKQKEAAA
ncbi:30S ribosomal protein THX [Pontibacter locisalis]|uniref:30S ribosomal protein THX n=1 Tax=Pontibacter locisalis TaxID=1719035 RepID=A0ABW5IH28_9BACT